MRFTIPFLLSAVFLTGAAYAQPTGAPAGTMPLSPNNCGTPDAPKACPGKMTAHHAAMHKAPAKAKAPTKAQ
jgi:hypothetical protein